VINEVLVSANPYPEPASCQLDLVNVLRALGDPVRLRIVVRLADDEYHPCNTEEYGLDIHKSTLSHHFKTLREAGLTSTLIQGRNHGVQLRRADLETRFPGVLGSVIAAAVSPIPPNEDDVPPHLRRGRATPLPDHTPAPSLA
jgi:DNA-binding transcriptional ArsR family regulator